jgi:riboflavin kinase/FMN adenylyltransferase
MNVYTWSEFTHGSVLSGKKTALSIGVFDGIHRGHQILINAVTRNPYGLESVIITFKENPARITRGKSFPGQINTIDQKLQGFKELCIDHVVLIDFSLEFSKLTGKEFIYTIQQNTQLEYLVLGENFHCGHNADTNAFMVKQYLENTDCVVTILSPFTIDNDLVSSTLIREMIQSGDTHRAQLYLGKPYTLDISRTAPKQEGNTIVVYRDSLEQIIPEKGTYNCLLRDDNAAVQTTVTITEETIYWQKADKLNTKHIQFL